VLTWVQDDNRLVGVQALDGRTGAVRWRHTTVPRIGGYALVNHDLPLAVLVLFFPDPKTVELHLLDGRDGSPRWVWKKLAREPLPQGGFRGAETLRPAVWRFRPNEPPLLAVMTGLGQLYLLDLDGKE
jgi:hypothetical protein